MQEVVITPKTLCSFFSLRRPRLYLGHIKSNSPTVTRCYVNGSGNSLKHCTGGRTVGANNNKVFTSFEWFRTTCSNHFNRLQCAGTDFQVAASPALSCCISLQRLNRKHLEKKGNVPLELFLLFCITWTFSLLCVSCVYRVYTSSRVTVLPI